MKKLLTLLLLMGLTSLTVSAQVTEQYIVDKYKPIAEKIYQAMKSDTVYYNKMAYMCDMFGPRLSGSDGLENAIKWIKSGMDADGLDKAYLDPVMVPHWHRLGQDCKMQHPYNYNIPVLSYGGSISTPAEGITGDVYVVSSLEELDSNASKAKGKILVYSIPFINYGQAVKYRFDGVNRAAKYGAIACLLRSITPNYQTLHTGMMRYVDSLPKIPFGAITEQDAALLGRLQARGVTPKLNLKLFNEQLEDAKSYNVVCELTGKSKADEFVAFGGHIDSWDNSLGAHDDASSCIMSWGAIKILTDLGLQPDRTMRAVMWANEENGVRGGKAYLEQHGKEKHVGVLEFDVGCFPPAMFRFTGPDTIMSIVKMMAPVLKVVAPMTFTGNGGGTDVGPIMSSGVPGMSIWGNDGGNYFRFHHSADDSPEKVKIEDFNANMAIIAISMYIYADLPFDYLKFINRK